MPKVCYVQKEFKPEAMDLIRKAIRIVDDYQAQGYNLTLRQVYYQFVRRDWFPESWIDPATGSTNNERSYKKLGSLVNDARLAGLIDWNAIEDRTRELGRNSHWDTPGDIIDGAARSYLLDRWQGQKYRPEVWVEKDALEGIVERTCRELDIPWFSCRGYTSQSAMWAAARRLMQHAEDGNCPYIIHLGDHDPSGRDMSRDIEDRMQLFFDHHGTDRIEFQRIALNMDQIRQYDPPPNPTKVTDSRAKGYIREFGHDCWELDALEPSVIDNLIRETVALVIDQDLFDELHSRQEEHRAQLALAAKRWDDVTAFLKNGKSKSV